jgi:hypothetical protein
MSDEICAVSHRVPSPGLAEDGPLQLSARQGDGRPVHPAHRRYRPGTLAVVHEIESETDTPVQARTVPGAEERLYKDLKWAGLSWDEGPDVAGPYGPYRQVRI